MAAQGHYLLAQLPTRITIRLILFNIPQPFVSCQALVAWLLVL
jgi:hypothetical protein